MRFGSLGHILNSSSYNSNYLNYKAIAGGSSVAVLRSVSAGNGNNIVMPSGYQSGDILVIVYATLNSGSQPTLSGWTRTILFNGAFYPKSAVYIKTSNGSEGTVTLGGTNDECAHCFAFSSGTGIEATAVGAGDSMTNIVAPTINSGGSDRYLISGYSSASTWTITVPGGQTTTSQVAGENTIVSKCGYQVISSAGFTGTRTATMGGMGFSMGVSILVY